ncbi:radical SAM protein [Alkalicella caledoniensis]|uniref:Radical SAM protein n=1 Tax=Alkalicella caledoniensis TaxID=2731377 RepID=A0A7G9WA46_ALKCA|nr:radical SAM protein [Alkalicella caledoniensis]QNO15558.1 radical SAM protein [Alkalicella caledoniensis]
MSLVSNVLGFELTDSCNFYCIHCYLGKKKNNYLNTNIISFVEKLLGNQFVIVDFTGGEPLLHPEFIDIYTFLVKRGYLIRIYTNGSILNKEIMDLFRQYMPYHIYISVYGMTSATYQEITGTNLFDKVFENIGVLNDICNDLTLNFTVLRQNYNDVEYFKAYCATNKFRYSISNQVIPNLDNSLNVENYRLHPKEIVDLNTNIVTTADSPHYCDAGKSIFIDSTAMLRGCPILKTKYDLHLSKPCTDMQQIKLARRQIIEFCKEEKMCAGWLNIEENAINYVNKIAYYRKNKGL